jgi:hypothetical protein
VRDHLSTTPTWSPSVVVGGSPRGISPLEKHGRALILHRVTP